MKTKRSKALVIRVSPQEQELIRNKAQAAGLTISRLIRNHLGRQRVCNRRHALQQLALLLSINNHLAAVAEATSRFPAPDAVAVTAYISAIHRKLDELSRQTTPYVSKVFPQARPPEER